ncbi:MAG TPA: PAS domain S-box protein [Solirubrobacteraceae bacterium]|nr:PAS domain S-box protein [Solirubrobacteraceae bacterium]
MAASSLHDGPNQTKSSGGTQPPAPVSGILQHRLLFERNPQPMMVYEWETGDILAVSNAAVDVYGYSREEFIGLSLRALVPESDLASFDAFHAVSFTPETPGLQLENRRRHVRKDGSIIEVIISGDDIEVDGQRCRMLICEDVTAQESTHSELAVAREQLRTSEERYRRLFEQNPQAMVAYDRGTLEIVAASNAMVAGYGYSREELESMTILDLVLPEDVDMLRSYLGKGRQGSTPKMAGTPSGYPSRRQRKDGTVIDIEVTSENIELDGRDCRLALYTDVTERNKTMAALEDAREQLRVSEGRYRSMFEQNPQPMATYDRQTFQILAVSDAMVDRYGYTREELCSMTILDLELPEDAEALRDYLRAHPEGSKPGQAGRVGGYPGHHRLQDGTVIDIEVTSDNIELDGRHCRLALYTDVTARNKTMAALEDAREQLRVSEERYRSMFEQNPQPMVTYDRKTLEILAVSDAMIAKYGYTREELCSMSVLDLQKEGDEQKLSDYLAAHPDGSKPTLAGLPEGYPGQHRLKDGSLIDVEVTSTNLFLNGRDCRIAHFDDVTARNKAAREVLIARDQAVEASNMKSAFLANVSHEVRTPMNGVIGMTELLLDTGLDEEQRQYAEQISRSGEQMLAILNDILDLSKIEGGHLELDIADFDLHDTINEACSVAGGQARAKGLRLAVDLDPAVPRRRRGDGRRVRQVVLNLVSNAVKFTSEGRITVRVKLAGGAGAGSLVRVEVTDTGIGVDDAELERMFEPFTQADVSTTRHYGGTGLGLAIVKEIVEMMGGTIGATSMLGRGSTFWFEVALGAPDLADANADQAESSGETAQWPRPPRILVAEDSPVNQIVAARMLERCGATVRVAGDGREAIAAFKTEDYDLVLMDCQMPTMDGYAATSELRLLEQGSERHVPIIAMTAHALEGDRERCIAAGMDDYVSKPMRHAELVEKLHQWIPLDLASPSAAGDSVLSAPPRA